MRILFVTARPPWPGFRGDQARPAGWIRHLATRHDIRVVAQRWPGFPKAGVPEPEAGLGVELVPVDISRPRLAWAAGKAGFTGILSSRRPLQVGLFRQRTFYREIERQVEVFRPDVAVVLLSRLGDMVPALGDVPVVLDFVDALALNMGHRAELDRRLGFLWRRESRSFRGWDPEVLSRIQLGTVVAERDRTSILGGVPAEQQEKAAAKLEVLPFGLDLPDALPEPTQETRPRMILTGNLGYFPTIDGALWVAEHVWPEVYRRRPNAVWQLAGSRPPASLRRLAEQPGIELIESPPNLEPIRRGAAVAIAPLRSGSGTPIKILEAIASGVPVLTTFKGQEGLDEIPPGAVAVSDEAEEWVEVLCERLKGCDGDRSAVETAWTWLKDRHDLGSLSRRFESLLAEWADRRA